MAIDFEKHLEDQSELLDGIGVCFFLLWYYVERGGCKIIIQVVFASF